MKKITKLGVLAAAAMLMMQGCAAEKENYDKLLDPNKPVTLEIWTYYNGTQKAAFDELVTEFNDTVGAEKGIVVEAYSQGNVNDLITKVEEAAEKKVGAGEIPDIFAAYADTAYKVDKLGLVASIDKYMSKEELASYRDEYLNEGQIGEDGSLKIFPIAKSTELMMLNKTDWDRFAEACGVTLDELKTLEGVTKTARTYYEWTDSLTPQPNDGKAFFGRDAMANYMIIGSRQLGQEIFAVEGNQVTLNLDRDVFKKLWDNYYVPYIRGYFTAQGRFRSDDAKTGDLIALVGSSSGAAYFPKEVAVSDVESYPIESIVAPAPMFEQGEKIAVQQGAGMVVTASDTQHEYASVLFLKWFTEERRNIQFSLASGYLPVKKAANDFETIKKVIENNAELDSAEMIDVVEVAEKQLSEVQLYTTKAFEGGSDARSLLDTSMQDLAKADREQVVERLAQGQSLDEATAEFETEGLFRRLVRGVESTDAKNRSRNNVFKKRSNRNMLKKRSVFNRILIPLIVVQIFQISLFGMLVFSGGVITKLDRNAEEILNERVINRKNYLENEMIQRWSNFSIYQTKIEEEIEQQLSEAGMTVADLVPGRL